jgi:hypothetical protein
MKFSNRVLTSVVARMAGVALVCAAVLACAQPAPPVKILATDPAPDALLARQQPFFIRFELKSVAPATVTVSSYYHGKPVFDDGGTGAPAMLPAGGGIGVVSFFYWGEKPTRIDEVRLSVNTIGSEQSFPVALTWLTDDAPPREPAVWVKEWQQAQLAAGQQNKRPAPAMQIFGTSTWVALAIGFALFAMGAVTWQRARRRSDDDKSRR